MSSVTSIPFPLKFPCLTGPGAGGKQVRCRYGLGKGAGPMKAMIDENLAILLRHRVEGIDMHFDLAEEEIRSVAHSRGPRQALLKVPRHLFVPAQLMVGSY